MNTSLRLLDWERRVLPELRLSSFRRSNNGNLTVLAYFFWNDDRINTEFWRIECAFLCAFRVLGVLPAVLVVNRTTPRMINFCKNYGIEIQVELSLVGGLNSMSLDCIMRLYMRFKTDYVLVIQNDGFPVSAGVERFLGVYDYVGAPWSGHTCCMDFFPYPRYGVGNGGFSLRSKRICESASNFYYRYCRLLPYNWYLTEDVFYCKVMRFLSRSMRQHLLFPRCEDALQFSIESVIPGVSLPQIPPIGFHSADGFALYLKHFGVPNLGIK